MRRIAAIAASILVLLFAGPAMAAFELGNFHLVAYEEADNNDLPVGNIGNEVHYDLGANLPDITTPLDTGITLADYEITTWDDVYVGIFAGGFTPAFENADAIFSSDTDDFTVSANTYSMFQSASLNLSSYATTVDRVQSKSSGSYSYYANMIGSGTTAGTYAGLVNANSPFGAETQLIDNGSVALSLYSFDGLDVNGVTQIATWLLDTTSGSLVITDATDTDNDGIIDTIEAAGPNSGDANKDGIQDSLQNNVAAVKSYTDQGYIVLESPDGTTLSNCQVTSNPSTDDDPTNINFDLGFVDFTIEDFGPGDTTTLTIILPDSIAADTYYKYGQTPDNPTDHWYEFLYDGETGAVINNNIITIHFADAKRGDDVLSADSLIIDLGAPGFTAANGDDDDDGGGGGGGNGCFIGALKN